MVIARQRPATARGVTFMLLEDEEGVVNVIVPPPVYERHRLEVRTAAFLIVQGQGRAPRGRSEPRRRAPGGALAPRPARRRRQAHRAAAGARDRARRRAPRRAVAGRRGRRAARRAQLRQARALTPRRIDPPPRTCAKSAFFVRGLQDALQNICSVRPPSYGSHPWPYAARPKPAERGRSRDRLRDARRVRPGNAA